MELITPSFEIWTQEITSPIEDMYAHIARCTRVCYQSEKKDDKETEEEFVKRVILRNLPFKCEANHLAMLEHGTVYLDFLNVTGTKWYELVRKYDENKYSYVNTKTGLVTTNLRVLVENDWLDDLKYFCPPTHGHKLRVTVSFTTNIGVSREFNRHRVNSIAEESTRYCNYNKRNDGQIKIGLPAWLLDDEHLPYIKGHANDDVVSYATGIINQEEDEILKTWCDMDFYLCGLTFCNWCYNMLIKKGWKPQQAREVLPLATKSQLIHTAFIDDWKHFFALRADGVSGPPHPNAKLVAAPLKEEFIKRSYI